MTVSKLFDQIRLQKKPPTVGQLAGVLKSTEIPHPYSGLFGSTARSEGVTLSLSQCFIAGLRFLTSDFQLEILRTRILDGSRFERPGNGENEGPASQDSEKSAFRLSMGSLDYDSQWNEPHARNGTERTVSSPIWPECETTLVVESQKALQRRPEAVPNRAARQFCHLPSRLHEKCRMTRTRALGKWIWELTHNPDVP
jgi:hypothetical protein